MIKLIFITRAIYTTSKSSRGFLNIGLKLLFLLGKPVKGLCSEKTIMLVGATGSGKSTLVDGIANYIMGVSFEDPFRFKMVTLEDNEKKGDNQVLRLKISNFKSNEMTSVKIKCNSSLGIYYDTCMYK